MLRSKFAALLLCALLAGAARADVPAYEQVRRDWRGSDALLLDRNGAPLQWLRVDSHGRRLGWTALPDVSPALGVAVLAAEDRDFYRHGGLDLAAMAAAARDNLLRSRARGASTITMQLASLLDPALQAGKSGRTLAQKLKQALAARELEKTWSKNQILEAYLNLVAFRGELQGVTAAAATLFDKAPSGLDDTESALLAAMIRAPNAAPRTLAARACVLVRETDKARACGDVEAALAIALDRRQAVQQAVAAPAEHAARALLAAPGERVASTLLAPLQRIALASLRQQMLLLSERNVGDGAVLVLDNASGEILAYVGNAGDSSVDGVTARRQAGSTLKPFLYGLALERGLLTAASALDDSPLDVATAGGMYAPQNYDRRYKGLVSARTSLASSLNVPAVKVLELAGVDGFHRRLRDFGFASLTEDADFYGPSLALGSAEVSLLALTNAYRTLANGGLAGTPTLRPRAPESRHRVADARAAWIVADILSDRGARGATFGLSSDLATPYWSAVKTGTSKDMRDNWCVGFSARYTVGVWVGNFGGAPMWDVSGISGAAPVWREVMDFLNADGSARPAPPAGVVHRAIHYVPAIEPAREEWFIAGTESDAIELAPEAVQRPAIRYPADGSIVALDPDIPRGRQRMRFQAQGAHGLAWRLDGKPAGDTAEEATWEPRAGKHRLQLVDAQGREVGAAHFEVRGAGAN